MPVKRDTKLFEHFNEGMSNAVPAGQAEDLKTRKQYVRQRSVAVRIFVLRRANGICELCDDPAPFKTKKKRPYLEPHHLTRLADGGPDHPSHVAACCPNCHRKIHFGENGEDLNEGLRKKKSRLSKRRRGFLAISVSGQRLPALRRGWL